MGENNILRMMETIEERYDALRSIHKEIAIASHTYAVSRLALVAEEQEKIQAIYRRQLKGHVRAAVKGTYYCPYCSLSANILGNAGQAFSITSIMMHKNFQGQLAAMGVDVDQWKLASYRSFLAREEALSKCVVFHDKVMPQQNYLLVLTFSLTAGYRRRCHRRARRGCDPIQRHY